jgi:hypothetical protein
MLKISDFLWLNVAAATLLVAFVTLGLEASFEPGFYVFMHAMLAAVLTASLLQVIVRRDMSLFGSPLASVLIVSDLYFTVNSVKYFVPNRAYAAFTQTDLERFVASLGAWVVLMAGVGLLRIAPRTTVSQFNAWWDRRRGIAPMLWVVLVLGIAGRATLYLLGYGGGYSEGFNAARIRSYWDLLIISYTSFFDVVGFVLGACVLVDALHHGRLKSWTSAAAAAAILASLLWAAYLQARMPFLFLVLMGIFSLQVRSAKHAMMALQLFLLLLPLSAVAAGNIFTTLLGRQNVGGAGLYDTVGELGYRADLTDLAGAIYIRARGNYTGAPVVVDAISNAVPRVFWPGKDDYYTSAYYNFVGDIGLPRLDYIETPFSNGMVAYGVAGFLLWPLVYLGLLGLLAAATRVALRRDARIVALVTLGLLAMRVENEWEGVMLLFRDYFLLAPTLIAILAAVGGLQRLLGAGDRVPAGPRPVMGGAGHRA